MSKNTIELCSQALVANKSLIVKSVQTEIDEYINKYNEWGVGIELLIDYLCEENLKISSDQYAVIKSAMLAMELGSSERLPILSKQVSNT